jgi:NADH dehydrogenase [ubiquinone] 1 alpha subcomplex assembly factor 7
MTPLEAELRRIIAIDGPISVDRYMELCLSHPKHGYYVTRDPFGAAGDFVTAPEVSQMFGELIGAWAATVWRQVGAPARVNLIELGPGRGTLMADALRAAKALPEFHAAVAVHLVEISPVLRMLQGRTLAKADVPITWHNCIEEISEGPTIAIANEFVDALPISQFVKDHDGWHVRMIGIADDKLSFLAAPDPMLAQSETDGTLVGTILERRDDRPVSLLAQRIARFGGAGLIIDYGHAESGFGDTLQAVRGHQFTDPLEQPGEADLTAQVDFAAVAIWAERQGAATQGPIPQGEFLRRLGIEQRAARLKANATQQQAADIGSALARLTARDKMGELFKVLAIADPKLGPLPGFDT